MSEEEGEKKRRRRKTRSWCQRDRVRVIECVASLYVYVCVLCRCFWKSLVRVWSSRGGCGPSRRRFLCSCRCFHSDETESSPSEPPLGGAPPPFRIILVSNSTDSSVPEDVFNRSIVLILTLLRVSCSAHRDICVCLVFTAQTSVSVLVCVSVCVCVLWPCEEMKCQRVLSSGWIYDLVLAPENKLLLGRLCITGDMFDKQSSHARTHTLSWHWNSSRRSRPGANIWTVWSDLKWTRMVLVWMWTKFVFRFGHREDMFVS